MTSTWAPPPGPPPLMPGPGIPPPQKPNRPNPTLLILGAAAGLAGVIATTAAITYSVARHPSTAPDTTAPSVPIASAEQQAAAKKRVCEIFDAGTKAQAGKGGVIADGQLNIPVVLRMMNSASAVQSALTPEVPAEVAQAAREYVASVFDLTTEALGAGDVEKGNRLNLDTNKTIDSLLDVCGLPR